MRGPFDVIALGLACIDYITVLDRLPHLDEKIGTDNLLIQGGGPAATASVASARLGARTALVAPIASDALGRQIIAELDSEGVDTSMCRVFETGRSGFAFAMIERSSGFRTIVGLRAEVPYLAAGDLHINEIRRAKVLLVDGSEPEAQRVAAAAAREARVPVIFDAGNEKEGMEELIPFTDVLIASRGFGRDVASSDDPAAAARFFFESGQLTVSAVTAGPDGAFFHTADGAFHQPSFQVEVVDTTGAGDAFHGAYAWTMAHGWPPRRAAEFSAAVAAMKCTRLGGRTGLPALDEVTAFLARRR